MFFAFLFSSIYEMTENMLLPYGKISESQKALTE